MEDLKELLDLLDHKVLKDVLDLKEHRELLDQ